MPPDQYGARRTDARVIPDDVTARFCRDCGPFTARQASVRAGRSSLQIASVAAAAAAAAPVAA